RVRLLADMQPDSYILTRHQGDVRIVECRARDDRAGRLAYGVVQEAQLSVIARFIAASEEDVALDFPQSSRILPPGELSLARVEGHIDGLELGESLKGCPGCWIDQCADRGLVA